MVAQRVTVTVDIVRLLRDNLVPRPFRAHLASSDAFSKGSTHSTMSGLGTRPLTTFICIVAFLAEKIRPHL